MTKEINEQTLSDLSLKLNYAEMIIEDVRDGWKEIPSGIFSDMQTLLNSETITPRAAFLIHPDGKKEFRTILDEVQDIQAAIGGYFELIEDGEDCWVYADEDGRSKALEPNYLASTVCNRANEQGIVLLGSVLFLFKNSKDLLDKKRV